MQRANTNPFVLQMIAGLTLCCMACSADSSGGTPRGGTSVKPTSDGKCPTPGPVMCHCTDGQLRGSQLCNADGTLTACTCTPSGGAGTTGSADSGAGGTGSGPMTVTPTDGALCPQLASVTGCTAQGYESNELPANVLFVIDRSGSMTCNLPPTQDSAECEAQAAPKDPAMPSKWKITTDALQQVFDDLVTQKSTASVGVTFFSNDNTCGVQSTPSVPLGPLTAPQVELLKNTLTGTTPNGGTPLVGATILGYAYLHQEANQTAGCVEPCGAHGNRYVVLITDGSDSCPDQGRPEDADACKSAGSCTNYLVQSQAPLALSANIKTFVIGAPGSESARGYLSELAFAGGTARSADCKHSLTGSEGDCHFDMTTSTDFAKSLAQALSKISGAALGCEFGVPQTRTVVDSTHVNVQYRKAGTGDPVCFSYDDKPCEGGADGWQFAKNADGTQDLTRVVICGASCDTVRADTAAKVDVILGCQTLD